uniref:Uncharacterized protein n=1 Tax=Cyanistes caeruleus TaxID=156563 RepID=A0A8C0US64_CYACU
MLLPGALGNCCGESPERHDVSHQRTDWIGIHGRICHLLIPVLGPQPCFHSEKDRKHGKEQLLRRQVGTGGTSTTSKCFQGWNSNSSPYPGCTGWDTPEANWAHLEFSATTGVFKAAWAVTAQSL